jgi:formylglycine-generating enzyme required for sulfatase activity
LGYKKPEMKPSTVVANLVIASSVFISNVSASVIIDYITVGNIGNAADTTGYGAVSYEYQIGKYEVTNAQYAEFLNAKASTDSHGLYNSSMSSYGITRNGSSGSYTYAVTSGMENRPVVYVSWFDAARFSNWLSNGQGNGDTETGSYNLNGASSGLILPIADAKIRLPSEDEWYKAAYYNGATSTYSLYPNGQNSITTSDANYDNFSGSSKDVGTYSHAPSYYGTFDQGGNVFEWNDAFIVNERVLRGGSWYNTFALASSMRISNDSSDSSHTIGFRLASVPEPSSMLLTMLASGMILIRRKR